MSLLEEKLCRITVKVHAELHLVSNNCLCESSHLSGTSRVFQAFMQTSMVFSQAYRISLDILIHILQKFKLPDK